MQSGQLSLHLAAGNRQAGGSLIPDVARGIDGATLMSMLMSLTLLTKEV